MRKFGQFLSVVVAVLMLGAMGAQAGDWTAVKLRGDVFVYANSSWEPLHRGSVVPSERVIRTSANGRVQFQRGNETVEMSPDTQIKIYDRNGAKYTIVQQQFGQVAIEAERRLVQHFVVQTPFLAAVVKGTKFTVWADSTRAGVKVSRGQVEVRDTVHGVLTEVTPGQSATSGPDLVLEVKGSGTLQPVVAYTGKDLAIDVKVEAAAVGIEKSTAGKINGVSANASQQALDNAAAKANGKSKSTGNSVSDAVSNAGGNGKSNAGGNDKSNSATKTVSNAVSTTPGAVVADPVSTTLSVVSTTTTATTSSTSSTTNLVGSVGSGLGL